MSTRSPIAKHNTVRHYYDTNDRLNGISKATGKPYPTHTLKCQHCHKLFEVVHYPAMRWVNIRWCCRDCCWLHRYGRKYNLTPKEEGQHREYHKARQRASQWLRTRTQDEQYNFQHLVAQYL